MKFKLGDPVRVIARPGRHFDAVGTVVDVDQTQHFPFAVTGIDPSLLWFGPHELILAEHQPEEAQ